MFTPMILACMIDASGAVLETPETCTVIQGPPFATEEECMVDLMTQGFAYVMSRGLVPAQYTCQPTGEPV